jgi:hypothetical protein
MNVRPILFQMLIASTMCCAAPALAQDYNYGQILIDTPRFPVQPDVEAAVAEMPADSRSRATVDALTFSPNQTQLGQNVAAYLKRMANADPDGAAAVSAQLNAPGFWDGYNQAMKSVGLNPNSVADNMAAWLITAWEASSGNANEVSPGAYSSVKKQTARALAAPEFRAMSNAQRQELANGLAIQSLIISANMDYAKSDPSSGKQLASAVQKMGNSLGIDLRSLDLTDDGFVPKKGRKGADASDAMGDDTKQASAAGDDKTLQYGLMAALGLGAAFMIGKGMKRG